MLVNSQNSKIYYVITLFFIVPFLPVIHPNSAIDCSYFLSAIFLPCMLIAITMFFSNDIKITINPVSIFLALFITLIILQIIFIHNQYASRYYVTLVCLILALLIGQITQELDISKLSKYIFIAILCNAYLQVIFGSMQLFNIPLSISTNYYPFLRKHDYFITINMIPFQERITGSIGQPNILAEIFGFALAGSLYYCKSLWKYLNIILFSFMIAFTQSRMAIFYPLIAILIFSLSHSSPSKRKLIIQLLTSYIVICLTYQISHYITMHHTTSAADINNSITALNTPIRIDYQRLTIWGKAFMLFITHPILGVGYNDFMGSIFSVNTPLGIDNQFHSASLPDNAHNIWLHLLSTTGILGFVICIWIYYKIIRQALANKSTSVLFIFTIIMINLCHMQVEDSLWKFNIFMLIVICSSIIIPTGSIIFEVKYTKIIGIFLIIILAINSYTYLQLAQILPTHNYKSDDYQQNAISYYQLGGNPLWNYYIDVSFANKYSLAEFNSITQSSYITLANVNQSAIITTPYLMFMAKQAVLEKSMGNESQAIQYLTTIKQNYAIESIINYMSFSSYTNSQIIVNWLESTYQQL